MALGARFQTISQAAATQSSAALTDSTGGTPNTTVAAVADIALSTGDTYSDSAVNAAVNAAIATVNDDLADIVAQVNAHTTEVAALVALANELRTAMNSDT